MERRRDALAGGDQEKGVWKPYRYPLQSGTLSTVATDELCTPRAVNVRSRHVADATGGHVGVETRAHGPTTYEMLYVSESAR